MKTTILLVYALSLFFPLPALAVDARSCAAKSEQLKLSEREAYLKSCLAQVSSPANVKEAELQHKRSVCEQNAKNLKLQGNDKGKYVATCINKNEAETAAKSVLAKDTAKPGRGPGSTQAKPAKSAPARVQAAAEAKPKSKAKPKAARESKRQTAQQQTGTGVR